MNFDNYVILNLGFITLRKKGEKKKRGGGVGGEKHEKKKRPEASQEKDY